MIHLKNPLIAGVLFLAVIAAGYIALNSFIYSEKQGPEGVLADGEHFGFIHALTDNATSMDFDDALWLSGDAAKDAAIGAGQCTQDRRDECAPSGFFIKNEADFDQRLAVAPETKIFMQTWKMEETGSVAEHPISLGEFAGLINERAFHWRSLPYTITVKNGAVVEIREVYIP